MKNIRISLIFNVLTLLIVALMVYTPPALAATNCFSDTNNHWAESFICWMKEKGISSGYPDGTFKPDDAITRAETSAFLKKLFDTALGASQTQANTAEANAKTYAKTYADSLVNLPPTSGLTYITPGIATWGEWSDSDSALIDIQRHSTFFGVARITSPGEKLFSVHPSLPTVLYGKSMQLLGVEFCYSASTSATLNYASVSIPLSATGGVATIPSSNLLVDQTERSDQACRYYSLPTPITLTMESTVVFTARINFKSVPSSFVLGRTTFVLQPTGLDAALPKKLVENQVILTEGEVEMPVFPPNP